VAPSFGVELRPVDVNDVEEIERSVAAFARTSSGGLIVTTSALATVRREIIIRVATHHQLPAVYPNRFFATGGGLSSYGTDTIDQYRRAAGYVGRILKGERPADLPVMQPTKIELVINLKTAKTLGLEVVLLPFRIRAYIFRRHQPSVVAKRLKLATEMMGADAAIPIRQGGRLASRASTWPRDHFCRSTIAPRLSRPTRWNEFLPISMPITAIALLSFSDMAVLLDFGALAHRRGWSTAGPSH
jgi:hypothetical protein